MRSELFMQEHDGPPLGARDIERGLLITVEEVAVMWFGEVGKNGSASTNCQRIRRLIPDTLPARRIGNRWYVHRATAQAWAQGSDPASVMAHPQNRTPVGGA